MDVSDDCVVLPSFLTFHGSVPIRILRVLQRMNRVQMLASFNSTTRRGLFERNLI